MKKKNVSINKYKELMTDGKTPIEIFKEAKKDGYKNYECINLLMALFDMSLHDARQISHDIYLNNKSE